jgi:Fe-S-cluster containining protein
MIGAGRAVGRVMDCRVGCGACCIAISISSPIPGMPDGKPAGVRCVQLSDDNRCLIFGRPERPAVCNALEPAEEICGTTYEEAMQRLERLERLTTPE